MKILFSGDIIGRPGRAAMKSALQSFAASHDFDMVIANCENSAAGFGITEKVVQELLGSGIDILTSGNHIWDKKDGARYLEKEPRVLRPLNYPPGVPGAGSIIHTLPSGIKVAVINLAGRVFMQPLDCPFRAMDAVLEGIKEKAQVVIIDFHAEATSEKIAFGHYMDGRVSAVLGTHTHVQTSDARVLPGGTAYITDLGMTGPLESVIGVRTDQIITRFLTHMPNRYEVATGVCVFSGVIMDIDENTGTARSIESIYHIQQ
jgi:metallophosphoesterase (TIGR00282 family)